MSTANPDALIGRLVDGRYRIRSLIARGGMASVYVATDLRLERRVAVKIMHDHLAADEAFRSRFIREARAAARLQHPNLVNVYDQGEDGGLAYIVMEYIPGITLRDLLQEHRRLTNEQAIDILDALLAGLQVAHRAGIIHRDLKPENVLLADDGRIKLGDFGLARAASSKTVSGQVLLGTIAYLAPELVTRGTADIRSDIYSLGIMLYEMLTGEQPYHGDEPVNIAYRHANDSVPAPSEKVPTVPQQLDDLVIWATERDPEDRPADAGTMLAALRQAERELLEHPDGGRTAAHAHRRRRDALAAEPDPSSRPIDLAPIDLAPIADAADAGTGELPALGSPENDAALPVAARLARVHRMRRRRGLVITAILVLVLVLAAGAGWWLGFGPGSYVAVPAVVGRDRTAAEQAITGAGFALGTAEERNSLDVPEGQVIEVRPLAGERIPPGSEVTLVVSLGPAILPVPPLVGLSTDDAGRTIEAARFTYDPATNVSEFSDEVDEGTVIAATNELGEPLPETLAEQEPIRLVVSLGPVPDVSGYSIDGATAALADAQLEAEVIAEEFSKSVPKGHILYQETTTDPVRPGDTINLIASKGPDLVTVPNVVGTTFAEATSILEAAGLEVSKPESPIPGVSIDQVPVTRQDPAPDTRVDRGATVTIGASF